MKLQRLKEIQERADKATPGPWEVSDRAETCVMRGNRSIASAGGYTSNVNPESVRLENIANGDFIAHARQDIPYLLSLLSDVEGLVEEVRKALEYTSKDLWNPEADHLLRAALEKLGVGL